MAAPAKPSETMQFYDVAMRVAYAVNPWKSRLTLNFKGVKHSTTWVPLPDIPQVRRSLDVPPCRKFSDGTDYYTLPILIDRNTNTKIGDSFDIAIYLQKTYPASGAGDLFPPQTQNLEFDFKLDSPLMVPLSERNDIEYGDYSQFNTSVDEAFTAHVALTVGNLPFDPASAEASKAEFARRAGLASWDDFQLPEEAREQIKKSFHVMLGNLGKLFDKDNSGPFLLGKKASYADLVVGGWLRMLSAALPESEWEEVRSCHGGVFGRLHDGLEKYADVY